eukprot:1271291-Amphidinium_carterae.1
MAPLLPNARSAQEAFKATDRVTLVLGALGTHCCGCSTLTCCIFRQVGSCRVLCTVGISIKPDACAPAKNENSRISAHVATFGISIFTCKGSNS